MAFHSHSCATLCWSITKKTTTLQQHFKVSGKKAGKSLRSASIEALFLTYKRAGFMQLSANSFLEKSVHTLHWGLAPHVAKLRVARLPSALMRSGSYPAPDLFTRRLVNGFKETSRFQHLCIYIK